MPDGHNNIAPDEAATSLKLIDGGKTEPIKDGQKGPDKLTNKQRAFVKAMLKGAGSQSAAYREAYDCDNMSAKAINCEASKLMQHPVVAQRLTAGYAAIDQQTTHSAASLRLHIEKGLFDLTTKAETDSAKLRAFELLGKSEKVGFFLDRSAEVSTEELSEDEVLRQLEEKFREAFGEPTDAEPWGGQ
jgi:hypothetical protein